MFARAPVPGRVKTRLAPRLGAWRAARLQARLTERALRTALACGARVELHAAPRAGHRYFLSLRERYPIGLRTQKGRDLGERMQNACAVALRRNRAVILIGSDCPVLSARDLRSAAALLRGGYDAVVAPAEDGGYGLIGLSRPLPQVFRGIEWGGPDVFAATARHLTQGWHRWRALRKIWDVDRPEDLDRLATVRLRAGPQR